MANNIQLMLSAFLDNNQYPIVTRSKTIITTSHQIKEEGYIVVCQPGTAEVAKSKEKGIVSSNKMRKARKGIKGLDIDGLIVFAELICLGERSAV